MDLKNKGYILVNIIECGVKAGTTGMKHSEESKRKISEGLKGHVSPNKGKKQSKETCDKKSKSMLGKKVRLGIKDSDETRKKKSIGIKNRDPKWIEKRNKSMGDKLKDLKVSVEVPRKLFEASYAKGSDLVKKTKAYENLKKKYPSEMSQPASLQNCIGYLKSSITSFTTTLEELKKKAV